MKITYQESLNDIDNYWDLFIETGWNKIYKFNKIELNNALNNSWYFVSAYDDEELMGFGRIISDGIYHALIVDLIIGKKYRRMGIGGAILDKLLKKCKTHNIRDIQLFSAKDKLKFYKKFNFQIRPRSAPGMQYKHPQLFN